MTEPTRSPLEPVNQIGEAPASATLSVVTPKGYNTLFTLREMSGTALLEKIAKLEETLDKLGYKPQVKQSFGGAKKEVEYVEGKKCPVCNGRLVKKTKKDGAPYHKCEFGKYIDGVASGCPFVDWLNPVVPMTDKKNPYANKDEHISVEDWEALTRGVDTKQNAVGESFGTEPI